MALRPQKPQKPKKDTGPSPLQQLAQANAAQPHYSHYSFASARAASGGSVSGMPMVPAALMPDPEPKELPKDFAAAPIVALRAWRLRYTYPIIDNDTVDELSDLWEQKKNPFEILRPGWKLMGIGVETVWRAKVTTAVCDPGASFRHGGKLHDAPFQTCSCGIWALKNIDENDFFKWMVGNTPEVFVIGKARLWGRVFEHEAGYRAEHAEPVELKVHVHPESPLAKARETIIRDLSFYDCDVK